MKHPNESSRSNELETERFFSVELLSRESLKGISISGDEKNVLIEGTIGRLQRAGFAEGIVLEILGSKGVLRINLEDNEIRKAKEEKDD